MTDDAVTPMARRPMAVMPKAPRPVVRPQAMSPTDEWAPPTPLVARALDPRTVYETEYVGLVRLAVSLVDSRERAEEIVQDAVVRALRRWDKLANPGGYLRVAVVNGCRNELRRRALVRRRAPGLPDRPELEATATEHGPRRDELLDALATLSPRRRIAVVLHFWLDLPEAEVAEMLGVKPGTARSLVARGLADLRKVITR
jgi:RNA polymerase sigma factor (sigma-70 family)